MTFFLLGQALLGGWFMGVVRFGCACVYGVLAILSIGYFRGGEWVVVGVWMVCGGVAGVGYVCVYM